MSPSTTDWIQAGSAAYGNVLGVLEAIPQGDSGFKVSQGYVRYPKEFTTDMWVGAHQSVNWDILRFTASGVIYDNELAVNASGYISSNSDPLVGYPGSAHPNVPINRF